MQNAVPGGGTVADAGCLALVQVVGANALRARVPAAFARGEVLLRNAVDAVSVDHGGQPVPSSSRGVLLRFDSTIGAVRFGVRLQEVLLDLDWPATLLVRPEAAVERGESTILFRGLRARIAVHVGRIDLEEDSGVEGPAVYQVARIAAVCHGGQVVLSCAAADGLALDPDIVSRPLGAHFLDGVDGEVDLHEVVSARLGERAFPELLSQSNRRSNLPPGDEGAAGRFGDLGALTELLALGVRTVSIVGPPGVGKSVLVRQFARARMVDARFTGGTWLVRLEAPTLNAVIRATAWALGVPLDEATSTSAAIDQLGFALTARGRTLLVIDCNGELNPEAIGAIGAWIRANRQLTVVVGSRVRLGLEGEVAYALRPLPVPTGENLRNSDAVRIYAGHARAVDEDFAVEDPAVVAQLVERTEGRPIAVRLLAGFVDRLPPNQQLERIVAGGLDTQALLDALLDLLDPEEWAVLVAGSVLRGSFDVRMLDQLGPDSLGVVERLERRGLVRAQPDLGAPQVHRYASDARILERVLARLPAEERLAQRERRAHQLVRWCERLARTADSPDRPEVVARLAVEWEGLLQAVSIGLDPERDEPESVELALRACLALEPVLEARGPLFLGLELLDAVLKRTDAILGSDPLLQLRVLVMRARALRRAGRGGAARVDLDRAAAIAERWSDVEGSTDCRIELGRLAIDSGAAEAAVAILEPVAAACRERKDIARHAQASALLGVASLAQGRFEEGEQRLVGAVDALARLGLVRDEARALGWLAVLYRRSGRYPDACERYDASIRHLRRLGMRGLESRARADLGLIDVHLDRSDRASEALGEAVRLARTVGDRRAESIALRHLGLLAVVKGATDEALQHLLGAMAIDRDRGDRRNEGLDSGFVGMAHHLGDNLDAGRDSYRRGITALEEAEDRTMVALFWGWLAGLEAEAGDTSARELYQAALMKHAETADPQIGEALLQLRGLLDLMEANLADQQGDVGAAARWRKSARDRWDEAAARKSPLPVEARLAHERVARIVNP